MVFYHLQLYDLSMQWGDYQCEYFITRLDVETDVQFATIIIHGFGFSTLK